MVNPSTEFLNEVTKTHRNLMTVSGYFVKSDSNVVVFDDTNLTQGSLKISKKSVSKNHFDIGEAYIDMLEMSLNIDETNDWSGLVDSELHLTFKIQDDLGVELECSLGSWDIKNTGVLRKQSSVAFTGDSRLNRLDVPMETQTSGTPYELVSFACSECDVPFRMTSTDFEAFVNDEYVYYAADLTKISTYRDLVMWISQILCGYCTIDMDGYLVMRQYQNRETFTPNANTILSSSVGDYSYQLTGLLMSIDGELFTSGVIGQGNYIELDSNPLLLAGTPDFKQIVINNMYFVLSSLVFKDFSLKYNGNPSLECGDTLVINDRDLSCPVQRSDWKYRGKSTIEGYLPDTASDVSNQSVKNSETSSGSAGSSFTLASYRNADEVTVGVVFEEVASISFSTSEVCNPLVFFSAVFEVSEQANIFVRYTYDNVVLDYNPRYTALGGFITLDNNFALQQAVAGSDHVLRVEVSTSVGSLVADPEDCLLSVYGNGVESQGGSFSGFVTISEVFGSVDGVTEVMTPINGLSESVSVQLT